MEITSGITNVALLTPWNDDDTLWLMRLMAGNLNELLKVKAILEGLLAPQNEPKEGGSENGMD
jgi:hypothetical protein